MRIFAEVQRAEFSVGTWGRGEADKVFVFKTLIFNTSAGALHQITLFGLLFVLR